jgi:hypothetical protein
MHKRCCAVLLLGALLLAGCRVDARVDITLNDNGSGAVRVAVQLDDQAAARIGGVESLRLDDLASAGWTVSTHANTVSLAHDFRDEKELTDLLTDLVGSQGVLADPQITRERGWFSSRDGVSVTVDLRNPTAGVLADKELVARLKFAGLDPSALDAQFTQAVRDGLHVRVVLHLPDGKTKTYDAMMGKRATVAVTKQRIHTGSVIEVGAAIVLIMLAGLFMLGASRGARRARAKRGSQRANASRSSRPQP